VLDRFPSVAPGSAGFVVADQATLAAALEAQMPGQGVPDELWISTPHLGRLRSALATGRLAALTTTYRADVQQSLRDAPVARAVMITLLGAAGLSALLAVLGLLVALFGPLRDRALEDDLFAQGLGPGGLRVQMRLRMGFAAAIGVACGLIVAFGLGRLAVAVVQAAGAVAAPDPPLTAVSPAPLLAGWGVAALVALIVAGWLASQAMGPRSGR
jgi:purine-cytosine permease-like protein